MSKIRIHELAKELGVENKIIIDQCKEFGFPGKTSHSHSLDSDEADRVRKTILRQAMGSKAQATGVQVKTQKDEKTGATVVVRRSGNIIRRRRGDEDPAGDLGQEVLAIAAEPAPILEAIPEVEPQAVITSPDDLFKTSQEIEAERNVAESTAPIVEAAPEAAPIVEPAPVVAAAAEVVEEQPEKKPVGGPKVLGKIELPRKKAPVSDNKSSRNRDNNVVQQVVISDDDENSRKRGGLKDKKGKKKEFSRGDLLDYEGNISKRVGKKKSDKRDDSSRNYQPAPQMKAEKRVVRIDEVITVGELAKAMSLKSAEIIQKLMQLGVLATINQAIDFDTATIVADEFGFTTESVAFDEGTILLSKELDSSEQLITRAPVVTVMGHVDHGKTSLLDAIRQSSVAQKEHGGITQHIGAYQVKLPSGNLITFIDTPGHEAFTEMRSRGAQVTDIVVLVVAADDGVMPQTVEAINHAKAANVPIVVAVNKIDKHGTNPDKIKNELSEHGLTPEDWGGDTMFFPVSALKKQGIKELLDGILLQAEVKELKSNPNRNAAGTVIESRQDRGRGTVATILVQKGTLKIGDAFICGAESGRVRSMLDHEQNKLDQAGPSTPVEITGLNGLPAAGDDFCVVGSDVEAREVASQRALKQQRKDQLAALGGPMTLEQFSQMATAKSSLVLSVIIKGDVQGSVEAVKQSIEKLSGPKVTVTVIHDGVGGITESDVKLAMASKAIIVGFNVRAEPRAQRDAEGLGVELRFYNIIYELLDDVKKAMEGLLAPIRSEHNIGRVEVRNTFVIPKIGTVAGCFVVDGSVKRNAFVRLLRDSRVVFEGKMSSLRRFKDDVREVQTGYECGIGIERYNDIKVGDVLEVYEVQETRASLDG